MCRFLNSPISLGFYCSTVHGAHVNKQIPSPRPDILFPTPPKKHKPTLLPFTDKHKSHQRYWASETEKVKCWKAQVRTPSKSHWPSPLPWLNSRWDECLMWCWENTTAAGVVGWQRREGAHIHILRPIISAPTLCYWLASVCSCHSISQQRPQFAGPQKDSLLFALTHI